MQKVGQFSLCVFLLARGALGGTSRLSLENSLPVFTSVGERLELNATVRGGDFSTHRLFQIYHRNIVNFTQTFLASIVEYNATSATTAPGYQITVTNVNQMEKIITLVIESVSSKDDGRIEFHMRSDLGNANETEARNITVVAIPETVKIKFGDGDPVENNSTSPIEVDSGNHTVYCIVEESNPALTDISLTLNGKALTLASGPDSELISANERKYTNNVSAIVEVANTLTGTQTLGCEAVDFFSGTHSLQLLYELNSAREGQTPVLGLVVLLLIFLLCYTM